MNTGVYLFCGQLSDLQSGVCDNMLINSDTALDQRCRKTQRLYTQWVGHVSYADKIEYCKTIYNNVNTFKATKSNITV